MAPYTYSRLKAEDEEIRLISLMPKCFGDDLSFEIFHSPLTPPKLDITPKRLPITDLRKSLPRGWRLQETLDGRYLFLSKDTDNSWDHPDPGFDKELYNADQVQFSPDYQPRYEALSYTWGSTEAPMNAYVVDSSCPGQPYATIPIGANLACALKHLRYGEMPRTLWVDFLCINQSDIKERNAQVNRMGNIYSLAERVVVWLGEESEDSRHALATFQYLGEQVEYTVGQRYGDAPGGKEKEWWHDEYPLPYDDRTWLSLTRLLRRPWFSRVWVLQEIQLGNHHAIVQCGADICPWITIRKSIFSLERKKGVPQELAAILNSYRMVLEPRPYLYFDNLLRWSRSRHCIDPRDKVYGILSLAPYSVSKKIQPRYSLSIAQTYTDAFLAQLDATGRLDLLTHCRIEQRIIDGASWIPNWSVQASSFLSGNRFGYARQASGFSAAQAQYLHPNILEVCGVQCARIRSVSTATSEGANEEVSQLIHALESENLSACYNPKECSLLEAALEVTLQGRTAERYLANTATLGFQSIVELQREYSEASSGFSCKANGFRHIGRLKDDKALITTTHEGYIGAGPAGVKPDDHVCIFLGCDQPIILRQTTSGAFLVVGPCFVHGLMDGEGVLGAIPDPWKARMKIWDDDFLFRPHFFNTVTKALSTADPRLPSLSAIWEEQGPRERKQDDPYFLREFKNRETGEVINSDPRMFTEPLKQRGIKLESFRLV